ncbi:hypothetical protein [Actinomadura madurae]|uniref:hypothetical protein n=1 Tax=Actinomadura madurae TaxID=1993 RepID=UPI0020D22437|nr:hypothetical protein [Actinomadura madurae]MCP9948334.1 hypothetical protein [Actinomadura madurae]MCP9965107.1 hypothetical protein [Actinomadura madurae]MCP9977599.1 hypothetical protein [Actinomadura madurae]MCQ0010907.1 hypothetical protein [Actinomadura madurae]MCQ0013787.1 hypothetical protein [Actinomadura madurae]
MADMRLADQCGQNVKVRVVKVDGVRARDDRIGCPLCRPTETDYSEIKSCSVETDTGPREGMLLLWRRDPDGGWHGIVAYKPRSRLVAEIRPAEQLRELSNPG